VSSGLPDRLSSILTEIEQTIADSEAGVSESAERLRGLLSDLEQERSQVHADLEHRQLERLVRETTDPGTVEAEDDEEKALRETEAELTGAYSEVSSLYRRVVDFGNLLAATRNQFGDEHALPGVDDAYDFTIRQAMIRAKEDERRRLSREIHDGPAQVLANSIIGLEFVERALHQSEATADAPAVAEIERVKAAMREGLSEIRRFIFDLRPTMLSQRGLTGTIEHYINTYRSLFPEEISLELSRIGLKLNEDQELTAFRILQESLQNIHRHAGSTKCWVTVRSDEKATTVRIRDNGRGFDPEAVKADTRGGSGIVGMRERAEVIGARLSVESSPGSGCEVCLVIPAATQRSRDSVSGTRERRSTS
jgi:two-component system, NarL family, sensor histidine kinase DegS